MRLGGTYALERLATDDEADRPPRHLPGRADRVQRRPDQDVARRPGVVLTGAKHDDKTNTTGVKYDATTVGAWW
ncbi:hypothetical protein BN6_52700 [Saccharothrix espanaensis DSM 44229]|uniref:Uncharacterized protein n=1 Tax=Saccharothrix espanaensis (strain ATCC 51144 / DSM 44229 / JCM 9112 / NBRC 15066 / NRRL 15764) TaxID=1179773 RepID=K0K6K9_SACES|nr:hypothetical protein BN6_52700 [Saccharothrix espanaensis DSM 44229]